MTATRTRAIGWFVVSALSLAVLAGCASAPDPNLKPVALVAKVDLPRFMGDWYVIANIPTSIEKGAHNAKDSYRLDADGTIATTFSFNADGFDGAYKTYHSRGYVVDARKPDTAAFPSRATTKQIQVDWAGALPGNGVEAC